MAIVDLSLFVDADGHIRHMMKAKLTSINFIQRYCISRNTFPRLMLFTKSGDCSLCDEMKEHLVPHLQSVSQLNSVSQLFYKVENTLGRKH